MQDRANVLLPRSYAGKGLGIDGMNVRNLLSRFCAGGSALLLLCSLSFASTILSGKLKDAFGNGVNGYVILQPNYPFVDTSDNTTVVAPITFALVNGSPPSGISVASNATSSPANTWYYATVYRSDKRMLARLVWYISGGTFDIGANQPTALTTSNMIFNGAPGSLSGANAWTGLNAWSVLGTFNGGVTFNTSVTADGSALKHKRVTGCTTGATSGNSCSTTITWTTPFADASYTASCQLQSANNPGYLLGNGTIFAASVTVVTVTTSNNAISGVIHCIAVHD